MNGISLVISKPCCPIYNVGTIDKIKFGTSNKIDLIPCRLSKLLHQSQRISSPIATKPMLKHHRVYSSNASKEVVTGACFEAPTEVSSPAVLGLLGIIGLALPKAWKVVEQVISATGKEGLMKSNASYYIFLVVAAVTAARGFLSKIICGFLVLHDKPFLTGDIIEVGYLNGQVIEMGLMTTSLLTPKDCRIDVPTSWFYGQVIMNKSRETTIVPYILLGDQVDVKKTPLATYFSMVSEIYLDGDEAYTKDFDILGEITNMMISNSNVYLEKRTPSCTLSISERYCKLILVCHLKHTASQDELYLAKQDVLLQAAQIIKKRGIKLGGHKGEVKCL